MNNDKLRAAIDDIANEISGEFGTSRGVVWKIVSDAILPLLPAPTPVDDKALAEAIYRMERHAGDDCYVGVPVKHDAGVVLSALRAAQQEVAELRKDKERLEAAIRHERSALYIYRDRQNGTASHKDITTGIELLDAALYPRAAGEGKGAT